MNGGSIIIIAVPPNNLWYLPLDVFYTFEEVIKVIVYNLILMIIYCMEIKIYLLLYFISLQEKSIP